MTLIDMLRSRAKAHPQRLVFTSLSSLSNSPAKVITYSELDIRARAIATSLQQLDQHGKPALLIFDCDLDYVASFLGSIYAGTIPVPLHPPLSRRHLERLLSIVEDCGAYAVLTTSALGDSIKEIDENFDKILRIPWVLVDHVDNLMAPQWRDPHATEDSTALVQYTSGSTGSPKGVVLSHGNLLSNFGMIAEAMGATETDIMVSWLPMYHDMGLIGAILHSVYSGMQTVFMPPRSVIRPLRWLSAISKYRGTSTVAPNFAYELCVQKIKTEDIEKLDLSSLRVAFNGAEPIHSSTLTNFHERFRSAGLRDDIFLPCYGLAEGTLIVSGRDMSQRIKIKRVEMAALADHRIVETRSPLASKIFVGCGQACAGAEIRIVNNETLQDCIPGRVGEIWVSGPGISAGYWNRPEATQESFVQHLGARYLRTGDLGFLDDNGELFITGRLKDLIRIRGMNYAPHDLESIAQSAHPLIHQRASAAFAIDTGSGEECVVLLQEIKGPLAETTRQAVADAISESISREEGIQVSEVCFVSPNSIALTSSGKIRRGEMRRRYLDGKLSKL
jgi:acyl-CoA synthetase (AMP-forming)/AMP-acid ligase II